MDFNGVIIDDEAIQMRAYQEVLKTDGVDISEEDYFSSLGMDDKAFVVNAFARAGKEIDAARIEGIIDAKAAEWRIAVSKELPLFAGIDNFIEKMSREFVLGIVSMARRREIDFVLETSGLAKFFSIIVSSDDTSKCKPDPECFRMGFRQIDAARTAQGHLPMRHSDCLVIEDSPPGVIGARAADLPALGVANTVPAELLRKAGAIAVAKDLRDWMPESIRRVF